ncbi:MAG TPA: hypothetical protein VLE20_13235 [Blastocatellia bacterium]|nr:hypothetical protein [Blastocatellia bacterium]
MKMKRLAALVYVSAWAALSSPGQAEDIDIFQSTPGNSSVVPNVLIILDNTANWSSSLGPTTKFAAQKAALETVVRNLPENEYNVGLMLFNESGGGGGGKDGSYVRYHIRPMNATNKTDLADRVAALDIDADKGSNAQFAMSMHEAYLYYGGRNVLNGALTPTKLDAASMNSAQTVYNSPAVDACQKNFIIFIGNGPPSSNDDSKSEPLLTGLGGKLPTDPIPLNPSNSQSNWLDEYARTLYQQDVVPVLTGKQNIITYTISVRDPNSNSDNQQSRVAARKLLESAAERGKGKYFDTTDLSSLEAAFKTIFTEIQAVNSVFAAVTLPVSVNVRGTNLNQVYMGVFRPDANGSPRWPGNLKQYKLALNSATNTLFLADRNNLPIESSITGFVVDYAVSFWTTPNPAPAPDTSPSSAGYFKYNPFGNPPTAWDSPDGPQVEKGGAAQRSRTIYGVSQNGRKLYTCTGSCAPNSALSGTPFAVSNLDISQVALGASSSTERDAIINWVRGQDNRDDENNDGAATDVRAIIHGDVLHSRPAVINYNRTTDNRDVVAYYGTNEGVFRAVKGGQDDSDGYEKWGFVIPEFFGKLKRLREQTPSITTAVPKPYFADGPVGAYQLDANSDKKFVATDGDKVYLYIAMRRGGRLIYALDVSDPDNPKLLWKKSNADTGYAELGQTWSEPKLAKMRTTCPPAPAACTGTAASPVLIFGAGYDPNQDNASVSTPDTMGRGIFVVNALTGEVVWQAGPSPSGATNNKTVSDMIYSIPSDVMALDRNSDGLVERLYVGDTGGNVWRVDTDSADPAQWKVNKLAAVGGSRKFLFPPDVVLNNKDSNGSYDAVLVGSGDREHPFETSVQNRYYMFKDRNVNPLNADGGSGPPTITEANLFDATDNSLQGLDTCATNPTGAACTSAQSAQADLNSVGNKGWFLTLGAGEKVIGNSVTVGGTTLFATNQPATPTPGTCASNLGIARIYGISFENATATKEFDGIAGLSTADRSQVHAGGGFLPSPVPVVVEFGGAGGGGGAAGGIGKIVFGEGTTPAPPTTTLPAGGCPSGSVHIPVIIGTTVVNLGTGLCQRYRTYWHREIDQ